MKRKYDVVVVGSGFGGGVTACRMAQAGRSVCVLEKGARWAGEDFPRSTLQVSRAFWDDRDPSGFLEYQVFKGIDVMVGVGVGGGSLHYFGVTLPAKPAIFDRPEWPAEITRQLLDPYYGVVKDMLNAAPIPDGGRPPLPSRTLAFLHAAEKAGLAPELIDLAIHIDREAQSRRNPHSGLQQESCDYESNCLLGCRLQAKSSLDLNYIPLAETNGAEVRPHHHVGRIEPLAGGGYRVHFEEIDPGNPPRRQAGSVDGGQVLVAAGTMGSTELLLRCRDAHRTLPELSPMLGHRFSGNGDFAFAGTLTAGLKIDPSQGPAITAGVDAAAGEHEIYIEDVGFPNPLAWLVAGKLPYRGRLRHLLETAKAYLLASLGVRADSSKVTVEIRKLLEGGMMTRFLPYLAMGTDAANGRMSLDRKDRLRLRWRSRDNMQLIRSMEKAMREMSVALGGKYIPEPLWPWPMRKTITAHPLGGCPMGDSWETGLVNQFGEVWRYPGLFVVDGAIIPTALAINPSMTIAALAERIAFQIVHGREMTAGGDPASPASA